MKSSLFSAGNLGRCQKSNPGCSRQQKVARPMRDACLQPRLSLCFLVHRQIALGVAVGFASNKSKYSSREPRREHSILNLLSLRGCVKRCRIYSICWLHPAYASSQRDITTLERRRVATVRESRNLPAERIRPQNPSPQSRIGISYLHLLG